MTSKNNMTMGGTLWASITKTKVSKVINPFSPETLQSMQPLQPSGFQQWSWKCLLCYSKCNIWATTAPRTLKFGTLMATLMFCDIPEFQVKFHCFYRSHYCPSQLKPHLKLTSLCSALDSTWCQKKTTKNTWNLSICAKNFIGSDEQDVSLSHFSLLEPGACVLLRKLLRKSQ